MSTRLRKISEAVSDVIKDVNEANIFKDLEKDNKHTLPKIPVGKVFLNDMGATSGLSQDADTYFENDEYLNLPVENVKVKDIVPTQKNLNINNLKSTKDVGEKTGAYLLKHKGLYYILDGHHRIANEILKGNTTVKAHVFNYGTTNPFAYKP